MKIEVGDENKRRWKVVRADRLTDVPGEIVSADEATGECVMHVKDKEENKTLNLGQGGIKIVPRGRGGD